MRVVYEENGNIAVLRQTRLALSSRSGAVARREADRLQDCQYFRGRRADRGSISAKRTEFYLEMKALPPNLRLAGTLRLCAVMDG